MLGATIPSIDRYLLPIIFVIVLLSVIPPFLEWRKHRKVVAPTTDAEARPKPRNCKTCSTAKTDAELERGTGVDLHGRGWEIDASSTSR